MLNPNVQNGGAAADPTATSPLARCHVAVEDQRGSYDEDLAWIIQQFKERVQADAVIVTIHYSDGRPPLIEVADGLEGSLDQTLGDAFWARVELAERKLGWREAGKDFPWHTLTIDMASNRCSRAVISALYHEGGTAERSAVEYVAERFQPVLTGYFKLWLLHRSTSRRMQTIIAALAPVDFGVIVIDSEAKIVFENPAAGAILDEGSALHRCQGSVCAGDAAASVRLRVAIDEALSGGHLKFAPKGCAPLIFLQAPRKFAPLIAAVAAVEQPGVGDDDPAAVIHLFQPPTNIGQMIAPSCEFYNLSSMETRLVTMLVGGGAVAEMAAKEKIKQDTVRTYLKNIFRKTKTKSQADLVRAMLGNSVRLRSPEIPTKYKK
jgi:DNA-binding CsgD family transcriptional regulator/PAS domain-containing protein